MPHRERMASVDAAWLRMDRPTNLMIINAVLTFDEQVDWDHVAEVVAERLVSPYPRFRQRVVETGGPRGGLHWEDCPALDLSDHLRRIELPAPGDREALERFVGERMGEPLDRSRPLWTIYLIDGYGGGSALYARMHHCIADGIALARVLLSLTDSRPDAGIAGEPPSGDAPGAELTSWVTRPLAGAVRAGRATLSVLAHEGFDVLLHPRAELVHLADVALTDSKALSHVFLARDEPVTALKGELDVPRRVAWSESLSLDAVKDMAHANDATVNDVLVAAMTGALREYLERRGTLVDEIHAFVPFNLRPLDQPLPARLGNKFGLVSLPLRVGAPTPDARLSDVKRHMAEIKKSPEGAIAYALLEVMGMTPAQVESALLDLFSAKGTAVVTNVPGPQETVYLAGSPVRTVAVWAPTSGSVSMSVSIFSYDGRITVGVMADAGLVPDPDAIVDGFQSELEAIARMGRPQSHTRAPLAAVRQPGRTTDSGQ